MKKFILTSILILLALSACDNKRDHNGDLGGMWQLTEWRNPTGTTMATKDDRIFYSVQLKLIEFGGRPAFYFYSKFKHDGKYWMGDADLGCATDAELADSVAKIKEGADIYARLSPLQYEYMEEHDSLGGGVWRTTYSDGTRVYVNYAKSPATADGLDIPAEGWRVSGLTV